MSAESRRAIGNLEIQPRRTGFWQLHLRTSEHPAGVGEPAIADPSEVAKITGKSMRLESKSGTYTLCRLGLMLQIHYASFDGDIDLSGICVADEVDRAVVSAMMECG